MKLQANLKNEAVRNYSFLQEMCVDGYFPLSLVDKGKAILVNLCFEIEENQPANLDELYNLTQAATEKFNELQEEFIENESEIETVARECIGKCFKFIAISYGFDDADSEELIAARDW